MNKFTLIAISSMVFSHAALAMIECDSLPQSGVHKRQKTASQEEKSQTPEDYFQHGITEYKKKTQESYAYAVNFFHIAASNGHELAQNGLGVMYENGLGTPRNIALAKYWYGEAAKSGNSNAKESIERISDKEEHYLYRLFGVW